MRPKAEIERVKDLVAQGLNNCEIVRATGIPLTTVYRWRLNPHVGSARPGQATCPICQGGHLPKADYAYLLGLFLGDGHVAKCPKGVFRLDVGLDSKYPGIIDE
jgi:hypothetical protein